MIRSLRTSGTRFRLVRLVVACAFVGLPATAVPGPAGAAERVLESDDRHVLLEITPVSPQVSTVRADDREYVRFRTQRLGTTEETGRPEVPVGGVRVALPPGATARLRVVEQQWSASRRGAVIPVPERMAVREAFRPNQVIELEPVEGPGYLATATYPERVFELSEVRDLRGIRVVTVVYHPVVAEVLSRSYQVLERAVVEITFEDTRGRGEARRPVSRPAPSHELWDRTLRGNLANASQARAWARGGVGDGPTVGDTPWGGGNQWKVRIDATGLEELSFTTLAAAGFPAGVPVVQVSVYQRSFDLDRVDDPAVAAADLFVPIPVPTLVRDRNNDALFNAGDGILLYGRSFRDQWMTSGYEHEDKYDTTNWVWIRQDVSGGARMTTVRLGGSLSGAVTDSLDSTPSKVFREEDLRYNDRPPDHLKGAVDFESEFSFWNDPRTPTGATGWGANDLFTAVDPVLGRPASVLVRVVPGGKVHRNFTNRMRYEMNGALIGEDTFYNASLYGSINHVPPENCLYTHTAPGGVGEGQNRFRFWGWTYTGTSTSFFSLTRFFMDWYEVTYERHLRARNDLLALTTANGPASPVLARVQGFSGSDILLFDVTDPADPKSVGVDPAQVVGSGPFDLRFDHDNATGTGAFVAIREAAVPQVPAERVTLVAPSAVLAGGVGRQYVIVAYDAFHDEAQSLASYRAADYSVHTVATSWVYDVFNNGAKHPQGIKGFTTYAYHRWTDPLVFLCLIGDANEDHRNVGPDASPDLLPSYSLYAEYEGAPEDSDQYYGETTRPSPGEPFDDLVDIYVGRFAVNTPEELAWNIQRTIEYENRDLDAEWRRRALLVADDQFSGSLGGGLGTPYGWQPFETGFVTITDELCDLVEAHPYDRIECEKILLSDWTHPCEDDCYRISSADCENELGRDCGFWYDCRNAADWVAEYVCMREATWQAVLPVLRDRLNQGVLLWNYQGHANRFFMAHEEIFKDFGTRNDVETSLNNDGKPFIFLGYACHLAEFDKFDEGSPAIVDCVSEKMMNLRPFGDERPGGAIAVFASSGFEFLSPNLAFNRFTMEAFFYPEIAADPNAFPAGASLPAVGDGTTYRWTLGESTTRSRLMFQRIYNSPVRTRQAAQRFVLLGDPALSPRVGTPELVVTVDGADVVDPGSPYFVDANDAIAPISVTVTATNGRGLTGMRIVDSELGAIDAASFVVTDDSASVSVDGVSRQKTLEYQFDVRKIRDYELVFEALDPNGKAATFTIRVTSRFGFVDGQPPAIFPNPFQNDMNLLYTLTNTADEIRVRVYTVNGRKVFERSEPMKGANEPHRFVWNGRDENGNTVANGTYFVRFSASSDDGQLETTMAAVKMR